MSAAEEDLGRVTRARMDVLERTFCAFLARSAPALAVEYEDALRHAHETDPGPIGDPTPHAVERQHLANDAALRLADVLAQSIAQMRGFAPT